MHRDRTQEDSREVEAAKYDLNYIGLTGEKASSESPPALIPSPILPLLSPLNSSVFFCSFLCIDRCCYNC
jgi:hypothetical protein